MSDRDEMARSVEDWARREADKRNLGDQFGVRAIDQAAFAQGIVYAFDALLSDEAVEAAADQMWRNGGVVSGSELRLAIEAAVRAVAEGERERE